MEDKYVVDHENGVTLKNFIDENDKLLSGLGIFAALVVLSKSIASQLFGFILSFLWVGGLVLIAFELLYRFPHAMKPRLSLFRYVFLWSSIGLIGFWLREFRTFWDIFLFIPTSSLVTAFILSLILPPARNTDWTRKLFGLGQADKTASQKLARGVAWFFLLLVSILIGAYIALGTNFLLDLMKKFGY